MITSLFPLPPVQAVEDVQGPDPLEVRQLSLQLQHPGSQPLSVLGGLPGLPCLHMIHDVLVTCQGQCHQLTRARQCSSEVRAAGWGRRSPV